MTVLTLFQAHPADIMDAYLSAAERPAERRSIKRGLFRREVELPPEFRLQIAQGTYGWFFDAEWWGLNTWLLQDAGEQDGVGVVLMVTPWDQSGGSAWDIERRAEIWAPSRIVAEELGGIDLKEEIISANMPAEIIGEMIEEAVAGRVSEMILIPPAEVAKARKSR